MSNLPSDLLPDILVRMSTEDLMRFMCVCSSWRNLIDCPTFASQRLSSSYPFSNPKLILSSSSGCYKLSFEQIAPSTTPGNEPIPGKVVRIRNPITHGHDIRYLNQSDNGLVLLIDETAQGVFVWNSSTRWHQKLNLYGVINGFEKNVIYGFGLDELSKDFKVVLIRNDVFDRNDIFVSNLRANSTDSLTCRCWTPMEHLPEFNFHISSTRHGGVFVNGAFHWIVCHERYTKKSVLVVDIGTEKYRLMPFPQICDGDWNVDLCVLGGCLCVTISGYGQRVRPFEAWVMKEYGVVESWSRLYAVAPCELGVPSGWIVRPVAYSNCGSWVLLSYCSGLVWYHLLNKSVKHIRLGWRKASVFTTTVYAASFFALDYGTRKPQTPPNTMQLKRKSR